MKHSAAQVTESILQRSILKLASALGARLFRNNTGQGWVGQTIHCPGHPVQVTLNRGDVLIRNARPLHAGLARGSADLIGCAPYVIRPEDVGKTVGVFTSAEIKSEDGRLTPDQMTWAQAVESWGGITVIARSEDDFSQALSEYRPRA